MRPEDFGIGRLYWAVRDAVIGGDASTGAIVLWNPAAERMFGYGAEEALGRSMDLIAPEPLRARHREGLRRFAATGRGPLIDSPAPVELPALKKSGEEIAVELTLAPLEAPPQAPAGHRYVLAVVRDVTERKRAEAERAREERARIQAEAALAARHEFLSVAAQELKTPITSLLGHAELALRRYERDGVLDAERTVRALTVIGEGARRLSRLVNQLIDVSRLEAGERLTLRRRPVDVAALVRGAVDAARATAGRHAFALEAPPSLTARVDPDRLGEVLAGLLDNAIRYSPDGGTIDVAVEAAGAADAPGPDAVRITVRDRGVGIPEDERERVFDRFHQAHRLFHAPGLGLGLYLARQIVEQHGGAIAAERPPDGGTRMVVSLPAPRDDGRTECDPTSRSLGAP